jgi:hypothetical protein
MDNTGDTAVPGSMAKLLAALSVAFFWLLPFSPLIAIGAVLLNQGAGWSCKLAVTGAGLCIAHTVVVALVVVHLALRVGM